MCSDCDPLGAIVFGSLSSGLNQVRNIILPDLSSICALWVLFPFLKYLNMIADKHDCIHAVQFLGGNVFLFTLMFKEVTQTLHSAVKQNRTTNNL